MTAKQSQTQQISFPIFFCFIASCGWKASTQIDQQRGFVTFRLSLVFETNCFIFLYFALIPWASSAVSKTWDLQSKTFSNERQRTNCLKLGHCTKIDSTSVQRSFDSNFLLRFIGFSISLQWEQESLSRKSIFARWQLVEWIISMVSSWDLVHALSQIVLFWFNAKVENSSNNYLTGSLQDHC